MKSKSIPVNKTLYNKVKSQAKRKFKKWPSAYGSAWLVKEYKRQGGKYRGGVKSKSSGISRWMEEKWIDVCKLPKKVKCGRSKLSNSNWKKKYPYCRPSIRVNSQTPVLASKLGKKQIKNLCSRKRKSPLKRMRSLRRSKSKPKKRSLRRSKSKPRKRSLRRSKSKLRKRSVRRSKKRS
jgi:hypothetical protein